MLAWLLSKPLAPGSPAPDFTLPDEAGGQVSLAAFRGRPVVLVFYPGDNTPGCTRQLCEFRDSWDRVQAAGAVVLGINPQGQETHGRFREKYRLPFPLLVDKGQRVATAYKASGLIVRRTVYLVGPDGAIVYARRGKPSPSEVLSNLGSSTAIC